MCDSTLIKVTKVCINLELNSMNHATSNLDHYSFAPPNIMIEKL